MTIMIMMFALSGLFLAILGYGIWSDFKEIDRIEQFKAKREERKAGTI